MVRYVKVTSLEVEMMLGRVEEKISPIGLLAYGHLLGEYLEQRAGARFKSEGDDVTGPWTPLKPATVAIRVSEGYGGAHPINKRTGELERYIMSSSMVAIAGGVQVFQPSQTQGVSAKLKKKFAGAQRGENSAPPRPVIGLNERDLGATLTSLHKYIGFGG